MVGCVGVAHPEKPKSGKTGDFGGNFDHSILKEDCTLMLPVFVTGGLIHTDGKMVVKCGDVLNYNVLNTLLDNFKLLPTEYIAIC